MAKIIGVENLTIEQVQDEVQRGGKFVVYLYCISVVVMTFRRSSDIYFIRADENAVVKGLPFTLLSFFLGWWGVPWGFIYTPHALFINLKGGRDITAEIMRAQAPLQMPVPATAQAGSGGNWW